MQAAYILAAAPEVQQALAAAREAWPGLGVDADAFAIHLAGRMPEGGTEPALGSLHLRDLCCACGCLLGDPPALLAFEEEYLLPASDSLTRIDPSAEFCAEVRQRFRLKALVAEEGRPPRIAEYAGRGPLLSWVRAAVLRTGLNLQRDRRRDPHISGPGLVERASPGPDPELSCIRADCRGAFKTAFAEVFASLPQRERVLLRLHLLDGLSIDEVGAIYRVHRATAARWIARAQQTLSAETLRRLSLRLHLDPAEMTSLVGTIRSQLDLSLSHLLAAVPRPERGPG